MKKDEAPGIVGKRVVVKMKTDDVDTTAPIVVTSDGEVTAQAKFQTELQENIIGELETRLRHWIEKGSPAQVAEAKLAVDAFLRLKLAGTKLDDSPQLRDALYQAVRIGMHLITISKIIPNDEAAREGQAAAHGRKKPKAGTASRRDIMIKMVREIWAANPDMTHKQVCKKAAANFGNSKGHREGFSPRNFERHAPANLFQK